jgi:hypothetical protein
MARIIYTERDVEDMARQGVKEIEVNDNVYITDVALEKMEKLGMRTRVVHPSNGSTTNKPTVGSLSDREKEQVIEKVRSGVLARLGPGVDTAVVDTIVRKVVSQL